MFKTEFLFPPRIPVPALHDGTLRWEDILHGTYEDFQKHHSALGIPTSDGRCLDTPLTLTGSPDCIQQRKSFGISVSDPPKVSRIRGHSFGQKLALFRCSLGSAIHITFTMGAGHEHTTVLSQFEPLINSLTHYGSGSGLNPFQRAPRRKSRGSTDRAHSGLRVPSKGMAFFQSARLSSQTRDGKGEFAITQHA